MTEEKADQIIRCVKECWWQILILFVVGLGLATTLFRGWPVFLFKDSMAAWFQAGGSIGAIVVAVMVMLHQSKKQLELQEREWEQQRLEKKEEAEQILMKVLKSSSVYINSFKKNLYDICYVSRYTESGKEEFINNNLDNDEWNSLQIDLWYLESVEVEVISSADLLQSFIKIRSNLNMIVKAYWQLKNLRNISNEAYVYIKNIDTAKEESLREIRNYLDMVEEIIKK